MVLASNTTGILSVLGDVSIVLGASSIVILALAALLARQRSYKLPKPGHYHMKSSRRVEHTQTAAADASQEVHEHKPA